MVGTLIDFSGDELVRKIMEGERDFSRIHLDGFDMTAHPGFQELNKYLKTHLRDDEPIDISGAYLRDLVANKLYLPNLYARDATLTKSRFAESFLFAADFTNAVLAHADLYCADLESACLDGVNAVSAEFSGASLRKVSANNAFMACSTFTGVNLGGAVLWRTNLSKSYIENSDFEGVQFFHTNFYDATLFDIKNLERTRGLGSSRFFMTKAAPLEREIILRAVAQTMFVAPENRSSLFYEAAQPPQHL